jgi:hypothetical protein
VTRFDVDVINGDFRKSREIIFRCDTGRFGIDYGRNAANSPGAVRLNRAEVTGYDNAGEMGMSTNSKKSKQVDLPANSRLSRSYGKADFVDAFAVDLPATACSDPEFLARHIFTGQPKWIAILLGVRDIAVWPFGLKRSANLKAAKDDRISIFRVFERHENEIILGEDDRHLDFRVSVLVQPASDDRIGRLTVTTLVFYNRLLGRLYLGLIAPFHRLVVRSSLDHAQKLGWPGR